MARADLTAMLGRLEEPPAQALAAPQPPAAQEPKKAAAKRPSRSKASERLPEESVRAAEPLYLRLERKEARLREDQYTDLTAHARRLNRAKGTGGDRITENTLIRVAIDLLLSDIDVLEGKTEAELAESVTNRVRKTEH